MKTHLFTLLLMLFGIPSVLLADSPITSTDFHTVYMDLEIVRYAAKTKKMDDKIAAFLTSSNAKLDEKVAVINAISWDSTEQNNSETFISYARITKKDLSNNSFGRDIMFCYAYLKAMDNYFDVTKATRILEEQIKYYPRSYTAQIILAIVRAQNQMNSDWCKIWRLAESVDRDQKLERDMRPEATKIILDYMVLYQKSCK